MIGQRFQCVDCGALSPELNADEGSTLISMKYGWRLSREPGPTGDVVFHWRCRDCWRVYKEQAGVRSGDHSAILPKTVTDAVRTRNKA